MSSTKGWTDQDFRCSIINEAIGGQLVLLRSNRYITRTIGSDNTKAIEKGEILFTSEAEFASPAALLYLWPLGETDPDNYVTAWAWDLQRLSPLEALTILGNSDGQRFVTNDGQRKVSKDC